MDPARQHKAQRQVKRLIRKYKFILFLRSVADFLAANPVMFFGIATLLCIFIFSVIVSSTPPDSVSLFNWEGKASDLLVEGFGFLLDLVFFGVLLSLYHGWAERRRTIQHNLEQLSDFLTWSDREGVLRKAGIIRRLSKLAVRIPDLSWAELEGADLDDVFMEGTLLAEANLESASLRRAKLRRADLSSSILRGANLEEADLTGADLSGAELDDADLSGAVLAEAKGLTLEQLDLAGWQEPPIVSPEIIRLVEQAGFDWTLIESD